MVRETVTYATTFKYGISTNILVVTQDGKLLMGWYNGSEVKNWKDVTPNV